MINSLIMVANIAVGGPMPVIYGYYYGKYQWRAPHHQTHGYVKVYKDGDGEPNFEEVIQRCRTYEKTIGIHDIKKKEYYIDTNADKLVDEVIKDPEGLRIYSVAGQCIDNYF